MIVMDYVTAQYPPKFIRGLFELTEEQINAALAYIEAKSSDWIMLSLLSVQFHYCIKTVQTLK